MTVQKAINRINELKPNTIEDSVKIEWLQSLDERIKTEIIDTHEGIDKTLTDYASNRDAKLLADAPYDDIYISYLMAQIDFFMADIGRYNNEMMMFNTGYDAYAKYINRTYKPIYKNNLGV